MIDLMYDVFSETVLDTLALIPFLFVTYVVMETLEHTATDKIRQAVSASGRFGPLIGSVLGAFPQCGFSAMAATLFAGGVISAGTFGAVVLSTSDEMIPIFIAHKESILSIFKLVGIKVAAGIVAGFTLDGCIKIFRPNGLQRACIQDICKREHCCCKEHAQEQRSLAYAVLRSSIVHTFKIVIFIFVFTFVFECVIEVVGLEKLGLLLSQSPVLSTFLAGAVGLIPTCGASVALSELYLEGVLGAGSLLSGLLSSGGVGLLVLWRTNPNHRQNFFITFIIYMVSVIFGLAATLAGVSF